MSSQPVDRHQPVVEFADKFADELGALAEVPTLSMTAEDKCAGNCALSPEVRLSSPA